jgi:ribosome assembly protein YihI (activator of Der GTPase)
LNITLLRQTWSLIETINASELLEIGDTELIQRLLARLDAEKPLATQERIYLNDYLHSKINLIKDTAESRLVSA